jgi:predicted ATP-binding protein involved in virulence
MMVLGYELIFRAKNGTLVIVDEPELSLHILWQDLLIDTLTQMGVPNDLQFLLATHSPSVLAKHPELERSLDR